MKNISKIGNRSLTQINVPTVDLLDLTSISEFLSTVTLDYSTNEIYKDAYMRLFYV